MSEKKRLQVGVEATATASDAFDFSSFQSQLQEGGSGGSSSVERPAGDDSSPYHTSYQCRKTSICEGLTTEGLIDEHRKSIAGLSVKEVGKAVDIQDLTGITLSKRHTLTQLEYEADLDEKEYESLGGYAFGMTAAQADEAEKKADQQ